FSDSRLISRDVHVVPLLVVHRVVNYKPVMSAISASPFESSMSLQMLRRDDQEPPLTTDGLGELHADDSFIGIRRPLCRWRPSVSSRWCCDYRGTPEPAFAACGMIWNTFET